MKNYHIDITDSQIFVTADKTLVVLRGVVELAPEELTDLIVNRAAAALREELLEALLQHQAKKETIQ